MTTQETVAFIEQLANEIRMQDWLRKEAAPTKPYPERIAIQLQGERAIRAADTLDAIAARLKALEFAVMRAPHSAGCPQSGLHLQSYVAGKIYTTHPDAKADCSCWKSAILDTVREVEQ